MDKIAVGVVYGGRSVEHEVSIISAVQAMHSLDEEKYKIVPLYIDKNGHWYTGNDLLNIEEYKDIKTLLGKCEQVDITATYGKHSLIIPKKGFFGKDTEIKLDVILPVTHGTNGEDGSMQGVFEMLGIPYAGPTVLGGAVGMDKIIMKAILRENNIPIIDYMWFLAEDWFNDKAEMVEKIEGKLGYPVICKPANLGSSVGIAVAKNQEELYRALDDACIYSERIVVEKCVEHLREINCSVLGRNANAKASVCEEPITESDFLTYEDKYCSSSKTKGMSSAKRQIPALLPEEMTKEIQKYALETFKALDGAGVARIDFIVDNDNDKVYVNEINAIPGSLSFYLWKESGLSYPELLDELIKIALKQKRVKDGLVYSFETNILNSNGLSGLKGAKGTKGVK